MKYIIVDTCINKQYTKITWNKNYCIRHKRYTIIKPLYIYVSMIGPISGHMTLTIATFPSTTPKIHLRGK